MMMTHPDLQKIHPNFQLSPGLLGTSEASQYLEAPGGAQRGSMLVLQHHTVPEVGDGGEGAHGSDVLSLGSGDGWEVGRLGGWEVGGWGNHWAK